MAGAQKTISGPADMANAAANIYTPTTGVDDFITQIHVCNRTGTAATFRLFLGLTGGSAAGTNLAFDKNVPANDFVQLNFYPALRRTGASQFISGFASAATTLVITVIGTQTVL